MSGRKMKRRGVGTSATRYRYGCVDILEAIEHSAWIITADGVIEHANQRAQTMFQSPSVLSTDWRALWPEENLSSVDRAACQAIAGDVAHFRCFLVGKAGERLYYDTTISPLRDSDGEVAGLLATARDVTKDVEERGILRSVVQLLPLPLTVMNVEDRRFVLTNRAVEEVLDLMPDEAIGRTADQIMSPRHARKFLDVCSETLSGGEVQTYEDAIDDGESRRHFRIRTRVTYDDLGLRHFITLGEDVTEQKASAIELRAALAQAEQASAAKSIFLANMSHEIRTPLNGIIAGAELLAKADLGARAREIVEIISASGQTLNRLLSDILDLARIEAGHVAIEIADFDLQDAVRSVVGLCALRAEEKGVEIRASIAPEVTRYVQGDSTRLRQVLGNLLNNAAKFTDKGEVQLAVSLDDMGRTLFEVVDTGVGFDDAMKARIFERFQQADTSYTRKFGGTGLGLAISRELVEKMGGELCCESTPSIGSRFWFALPLAKCAGSMVWEGDSVAQAPLASDPRVLAVDDHPTNRKVVELLLADTAEVTTAENGQEAVELYERLSPDLVLMDMQMPIMDGLEAVRQIRAMEARDQRSRTPIIMLTANALPEHIKACREAGADLHLQKPITGMALFNAINTVTSESIDGSIGRTFDAARPISL